MSSYLRSEAAAGGLSPTGPSRALEAAERQSESASTAGQQEQGEANTNFFRLFVSFVPCTFNEADLLPTFAPWGVVHNIAVLRDKVTKAHLGRAFVTYRTREEADRAIANVCGRVRLLGAVVPLQVKYAKSFKYVAPSPGSETNRMLFFNKAPLNVTELDVSSLFSLFGDVEKVVLFQDKQGQGRGAGLVTMVSRQDAIIALNELNGRHMMLGSTGPLSVAWGDLDFQKKKANAIRESKAERRSLFFSKVPGTISVQLVRDKFAEYGMVHDVSFFSGGDRSKNGTPLMLGVVVMDTEAQAIAAKEALNETITWPGCHVPMRVAMVRSGLHKGSGKSTSGSSVCSKESTSGTTRSSGSQKSFSRGTVSSLSQSRALANASMGGASSSGPFAGSMAAAAAAVAASVHQQWGQAILNPQSTGWPFMVPYSGGVPGVMQTYCPALYMLQHSNPATMLPSSNELAGCSSVGGSTMLYVPSGIMPGYSPTMVGKVSTTPSACPMAATACAGGIETPSTVYDFDSASDGSAVDCNFSSAANMLATYPGLAELASVLASSSVASASPALTNCQSGSISCSGSSGPSGIASPRSPEKGDGC